MQEISTNERALPPGWTWNPESPKAASCKDQTAIGATRELAIAGAWHIFRANSPDPEQVTRIVLHPPTGWSLRWLRSYVYRALEFTPRRYVGKKRSEDGRAYYSVNLSASDFSEFLETLEERLSDFPEVCASSVVEGL